MGFVVCLSRRVAMSTVDIRITICINLELMYVIVI